MAKKELKELTHAELEVMQILWKKKKALVREVLDEMPEPKPAYNIQYGFHGGAGAGEKRLCKS